MRQQTLNQLAIAVTAVRTHFQKDVIQTRDYIAFANARAEIYFPAAFMQICRGDARGTIDLTKYDSFIANFDQTEETEVSEVVNVARQYETDEEIEARINLRFDVMDMMARAAVHGDCRSMIVSGPAGIGKSFTVLQSAKELPEQRCSILKGRISPVGLFRTLWKHRRENHLIVLDDSDSVFDNETSLNLLKAACDSSDERFITWASNGQQEDENGEEIPTTFEFCGAVVFITNKDFRAEIARGGKLAPHFEALISRSHYIDLAINTEREYMVRIKSVVYKSGMMNDYDERTRDEVVQFIDMNKKNMSELSLRIVKKIADLTRVSPAQWRQVASVTCFK